MYHINRYRSLITLRKTQLYLTEHTLVYVEGELPAEIDRLTIPLDNIASAVVESGVLMVSTKPTAPS